MNSRFRWLRVTSASVICGLALAGCGGGDGGSDDEASRTDSDVPESSDPVESAGLMAIATASTELVTVYGRIAADAIIASQLQPSIPREQDCPGGGTRIVDYVDFDSSGDLSAGDQVSVLYINCVQPAVDGVENGAILMDILSGGQTEDNPHTGAAGRRFSANVDFGSYQVSEDASDTTVEGGFELSFGSNGEPGSEVQRLDQNLSRGLTINLGGDTVTIRDGRFAQRYDYRAGTYNFAFTGTTTVGRGSASVTTLFNSAGSRLGDSGSLTGTLGQNPGAGRISARSSALPLTECLYIGDSDATGVATQNAPRLRLSQDSTCSADDESPTPPTLAWSELVEGTLFEDTDVFGLRQ